MKFTYPLTFVNLHQQCNFENQLKQFCIDNKFVYSGIRWNSFVNDVHVLWIAIEWLKNKKYPNGEYVRYADGNIKREKKTLFYKLKVYPTSVSLNDAKEFLALEVLHELFANMPVQQPPKLTGKPENETENVLL
jgi:hypothetical protein